MDEFRKQYNKMPWKQIKALRNIVAHRYGTVDAFLIWDIIKGVVPELEDYCEKTGTEVICPFLFF